MKKRYLLLAAPLVLLLSGCIRNLPFFPGGGSSNAGSSQTSQGGNSSGGGKTSSQGGSQSSGPFTITLETLCLNTDGKTYPSSATNFNAGGIAWSATNGVGMATQVKGHTNESGYYDLKCIQFRKADSGTSLRGAITNSFALSGFTTLTIKWYATYETEAAQYFPVVKGGSAAGSLSAISANESSLKGTSTGKKQYDSNQSKSFSIYEYTTTHSISGKTFFSLEGASSGASYIASFSFE